MQLQNLRSPADQNNIREVKEKAVLHHPRHLYEFISEPRRVRNLAKTAIQDVMSFIRDKRTIPGVYPKAHRRAQRFDSAKKEGLSKGHDLHRERIRAKDPGMFAGIGNDDHLLRD